MMRPVAMTALEVDPHPLADLVAFVTVFPSPLGQIAVGEELGALLIPGATAPFSSDDSVRAAVRDLLRHGGYKPTGRGKPSSEYLLRAVAEGALSSINLAVDACNAVSLHSGLPVSVIDLDRAAEPLRVGLGAPNDRYVFNAGGQEIDVAGLLCLFDAHGPCANAVKDAQRTKTTAETTRTLSVLWGSRALSGRAQAVAGWYRGLLQSGGARTADVEVARRG